MASRIKRIIGTTILALAPILAQNATAQPATKAAEEATLETAAHSFVPAPARGPTIPVPDQPGQPVPRRIPPDQYPLLNLNPARYRFVASNDPKDHLGTPQDQTFDVTAFEYGSDWRNDKGFVDAVRDHTAGAADAKDALLRFGDWLGTSKPYGSPKYLEKPTLLTMFYDPNGVCYQAATILASAARLQGIPAVSFGTWDQTHQMTRAHVKNSKGDLEWMIFNANFGWNFVMPAGSDDDMWPQLAGIEYRAVEQHHDVPFPDQNTTLSDLRVYKTQPIPDVENAARNGIAYGTVDFQHNAAKVYMGADKTLHDSPGQGRIPFRILYRIRAADNSCLRDTGVQYMTVLRDIRPDISWRGVTQDGYGWEQRSIASGNMETILPYAVATSSRPECDAFYLVRYSTMMDINARDPDGREWLTYQKFSLRDGPVSLDPANEQCAPGARQEHCDFVKEHLLKIPPKTMLPKARY